MRRETSTAIHIRPIFDPEVTFPSFTICPNYHQAYKKDILKENGLTQNDFRKGIIWYPKNSSNNIDGRDLFINVTTEVHEIIDEVIIGTMSTSKPLIVIDMSNDSDRTHVKVSTKYSYAFGRCYEFALEKEVIEEGIQKIKFITHMAIHLYFEYPGQYHYGNPRKVWYNKFMIDNIRYILNNVPYINEIYRLTKYSQFNRRFRYTHAQIYIYSNLMTVY